MIQELQRKHNTSSGAKLIWNQDTNGNNQLPAKLFTSEVINFYLWTTSTKKSETEDRGKVPLFNNLLF
ncbi:hypothetical protein O9992_05365 [Vibrio lentus]|nr:hypothetical protein [Vibrio lentus]